MVALYRDGRVWVANAGDSRAVLGSDDKDASPGEGASAGLVRRV